MFLRKNEIDEHVERGIWNSPTRAHESQIENKRTKNRKLYKLSTDTKGKNTK